MLVLALDNQVTMMMMIIMMMMMIYIYYDEVSVCVSRKMITFLKGLSVVSVFFQGRFMVFHGFGWSP